MTSEDVKNAGSHFIHTRSDGTSYICDLIYGCIRECEAFIGVLIPWLWSFA